MRMSKSLLTPFKMKRSIVRSYIDKVRSEPIARINWDQLEAALTREQMKLVREAAGLVKQSASSQVDDQQSMLTIEATEYLKQASRLASAFNSAHKHAKDPSWATSNMSERRVFNQKVKIQHRKLVAAARDLSRWYDSLPESDKRDFQLITSYQYLNPKRYRWMVELKPIPMPLEIAAIPLIAVLEEIDRNMTENIDAVQKFIPNRR